MTEAPAAPDGPVVNAAPVTEEPSRKALADGESVADVQSRLNALIDNHTKWIDTPPAEGEDGYDSYDRDALIKERSIAHNALIAMGAPRSA